VKFHQPKHGALDYWVYRFDMMGFWDLSFEEDIKIIFADGFLVILNWSSFLMLFSPYANVGPFNGNHVFCNSK
jgi:hypothetical protein